MESVEEAHFSSKWSRTWFESALAANTKNTSGLLKVIILVILHRCKSCKRYKRERWPRKLGTNASESRSPFAPKDSGPAFTNVISKINSICRATCTLSENRGAYECRQVWTIFAILHVQHPGYLHLIKRKWHVNMLYTHHLGIEEIITPVADTNRM